MTIALVIDLEVEARDGLDALYVIDQVLDAGILQAAINEHGYDVGPVRVLDASVRPRGAS